MTLKHMKSRMGIAWNLQELKIFLQLFLLGMKNFFEKFKDSFLKIGKKDMNREKESLLLSLNCYPESKS